MEVEGATEGASGRAGGSGREAETGTAAVRAAAPRRYHAGALEAEWGRSGGLARQRTDVGRQGAGAKAKRKAKRDKYAHFSRDT